MARRLYKLLVGSHRAYGDKIYKLRDQVLGGYLLAVDPASVSMGYALYNKGELIKSGEIKAKGEIGSRLAKLTSQLRAEVDGLDVGILAVEYLRGGIGHNYLIWSVGAVVSSINADQVVEVHSQSWKKLAGTHHIKSDVNDAVAIGRFVIELCKEED